MVTATKESWVSDTWKGEKSGTNAQLNYLEKTSKNFKIWHDPGFNFTAIPFKARDIPWSSGPFSIKGDRTIIEIPNQWCKDTRRTNDSSLMLERRSRNYKMGF